MFTKIKQIKKTRKQKVCEWCAEVIPEGSRAYSFAQEYDGEFGFFYMHPECEEAFHELDWQEYQDGWMRGQFKRGTINDE